MHQWCCLIEQATNMLNLILPYRLNSQFSAKTHLNGLFGFNVMSMAPPGTKVLIHEKTYKQKTWALYEIKVWYISPDQDNYPC